MKKADTDFLISMSASKLFHPLDYTSFFLVSIFWIRFILWRFSYICSHHMFSWMFLSPILIIPYPFDLLFPGFDCLHLQYVLNLVPFRFWSFVFFHWTSNVSFTSILPSHGTNFLLWIPMENVFLISFLYLHLRFFISCDMFQLLCRLLPFYKCSFEIIFQFQIFFYGTNAVYNVWFFICFWLLFSLSSFPISGN